MVEARRLEVMIPRQALAEFVVQRGGAGLVFIPTVEPLHAGEPVRLTVRFEGFPQEFSLRGGVTSVRVQGRGETLPAGVTVAIGQQEMPRLEKILAFARGDRVEWHRRTHPRSPVKVPAEVRRASELREALIRDLSQGGAGLVIEGELPNIGETLQLRLRCPGGLRPVRLSAKVMWLDFFDQGPLREGGGPTRAFGVQFVEGSRGWQRRLGRLLGDGVARESKDR